MIKVQGPNDLECLRPFVRRIDLVDLHSTFVADPAQVDEANHVFPDDPTIRSLYQSPVARHLYTIELLSLMRVLPLDTPWMSAIQSDFQWLARCSTCSK